MSPKNDTTEGDGTRDPSVDGVDARRHSRRALMAGVALAGVGTVAALIADASPADADTDDPVIIGEENDTVPGSSSTTSIVYGPNQSVIPTSGYALAGILGGGYGSIDTGGLESGLLGVDYTDGGIGTAGYSNDGVGVYGYSAGNTGVSGTSASGTGVSGNGSTGVSGSSSAGTGVGVYATSASGTALEVVGTSDFSDAMAATSITATGAMSGGSIAASGGGAISTTCAVSGGTVTATGAVKGGSISTTGAVTAGSVTASGGVSAATLKASSSVSAPSVTASASGSATGLTGSSTSGVGVLAESGSSGTALKVSGKLELSRSGLASVAKKAKSVKVTPVPGVTAASMIIATIQGAAGGTVTVANAVPATNSFTINLTAAAPNALKVAWFVIN